MHYVDCYGYTYNNNILQRECLNRGRFFTFYKGVTKSGSVGRRQQLHGVRQGFQSLWHRNGGAGSLDGWTAKRPERRTAAVSDCRGPTGTRAVYHAAVDFVQGEYAKSYTKMHIVKVPKWYRVGVRISYALVYGPIIIGGVTPPGPGLRILIPGNGNKIRIIHLVRLGFFNVYRLINV